jgi:Tfp pilus assembly protein PilO
MKLFTNFYSKLSKSERRIFAVTALFLGFVFIDRVIVMPITTTLTGLSANVREQESSIRKSMAVLQHKETILAESKEYMAYSVEAKNPEEEMVGLLKEVESVAERSGVSLIYVKPGTVKEEKGIKKYYANLECEAPMEQVAAFFHDIESSNALIKIEKYQIQPKSKESSTARSTISVYKTVLS